MSLTEIEEFLEGNERVYLTEEARDKVVKSRNTLEKLVEESEEPIYGVTTGFGKLVDRQIEPENRKKLQENLIKSHSAGLGEPLSRKAVDTAILIRVSSLCSGYSGIRLELADSLVKLLNSEVTPFIPKRGSLGASGDLAPLAHVASVLIGNGKAFWRKELLTGSQALEKAGLEPVELIEKEGLALINGTPFMTSIIALVYIELKKLMKTADIISSLTAHVLNSNFSPFDKKIHDTRPYPTQSCVAKNIRKLWGEKRTYSGSKNIQDAYSIRCIPQVHGAARLAVNHLKEILSTELRSSTDNPLVFQNPPSVLSGGNFHGEPLALGADYATIALTEMSNISERRINRTLNPQLNNELPPFLSPNPGLNSGYMMAHYSVASLVSENRTLCMPSSADNISVSADQEDHVSMGMNSALNLRKVANNLKQILAVELLSACQAQEFKEDSLPPILNICYETVRKKVPAIREDVELRPLMKEGYRLIDEHKCLESIEGELNLC